VGVVTAALDLARQGGARPRTVV